NAGGLLTPMGDPPLFLGFLRGVPFTWTLRLWRPWLLANAVLLVLFYIVDSTIFRAEDLARPGDLDRIAVEHQVPIRVAGKHNAPTYLTFASAASGAVGTDAADLGQLLHTERGATLLAAICMGSVFMGANTYIGNGPNFMVKAIAEQSGVRMPGFFGYMGYSLA